MSYDTIQGFFRVAMSRDIPALVDPPTTKLSLNLGAGKKKVVPWDPIPLDRPHWNAGWPIPYANEHFREIHAYHFFEHLTGEQIIHVLGECQRVLITGGVINIVVPYYSSQLMALSIDHKTSFCEDTLKNLFTDDYWDYPGVPPDGWRFEIGLNVIIGVVERNLALLTQLIKV